jgi:hypothetical protein
MMRFLFPSQSTIVLKDHGIEKQTYTQYLPQQNGVAEFVNCTIVEMAKNMLHAKKLDKSFWKEAVVNVFRTQNCCLTKALESIMHDEVWSGRRPCVAHMRVVGCVAYAMVADAKRASQMQKTKYVCFWIIVRGLTPIDLCAYKLEKSQ